MVHKALPRKLVARLRKASQLKGTKTGSPPYTLSREDHNEIKLLSRLKNADHRKDEFYHHPKNTTLVGRRIRELDVSRNYPAIQKVILKRVHDSTARNEIKKVREMVFLHNSNHKPKQYTLKQPKAYPITHDIVAMAKANYPSLEEIIGGWRSKKGKTSRGQKWLKDAESKGATLEKLIEAKEELLDNLDTARVSNFQFPPTQKNFLVADYVKGKFVFVPLIDMF